MLLEQDRENAQSGKTRRAEKASGHGELVGVLGGKLVNVLKKVHQGILEATLQILVAAHELVENVHMLPDAGEVILGLEDAERAGWGSVLEKSSTGGYLPFITNGDGSIGSRSVISQERWFFSWEKEMKRNQRAARD